MSRASAFNQLSESSALTSESAEDVMMHELDKSTAVSTCVVKLGKVVILVGLIALHKTGCSGEMRLVPHILSVT